MKRVRPVALVTAALTVTVLSACGGGSDSAAPAQVAASPAPSGEGLAGVCPATVVIQQDWEPEAEHSGVYQLVGAGYTVDANRKRVSGPLVAGGKDMGVKVEVRAGGAAIGFTPVAAQMYVDKTITLGAVSTDYAIGTSGTQPTTAVVSQLNKSPQMIMWDPASHPDWNTVADIGKTDTKVLVAKGVTYASLLTSKGLLKAAQLDEGYTGAPARFVTDPKIAQQGFATAEPYVYENEVQAWKKPLKYQLLADVGYDIYPEAMAVRSGELQSMAPCLKKLVPILQQAQIDYLKDPAATNKLIVDAVTKYNDGWTYSLGVADYAAKQMKELGIVADEPSGGFGSMDPARVKSVIDTFQPLLTKTGSKVKAGLTPADLSTNEFIDTSVKLG